jgi:hypothetical protein
MARPCSGVRAAAARTCFEYAARPAGSPCARRICARLPAMAGLFVAARTAESAEAYLPHDRKEVQNKQVAANPLTDLPEYPQAAPVFLEETGVFVWRGAACRDRNS